MLKQCKFIMICWFGMPRKSVINYTTRIMRLISLYDHGEDGLVSIIKAVMCSYNLQFMIGDTFHI